MSERADVRDWEELAERLTAPDADRALVLETIHQLGTGAGAPQGPVDAALADRLIQDCLSGAARPIGIWEPRLVGGERVFVRNDEALTRHWWPPHETLEPKRALLPLRVCLLGESTAAGWFYAPLVTPARYLEGQLNRARGVPLFEVLDLSMVNLQPRPLVELVAAVTQLSPDVLVVFAGNNWAQRLPAFADAAAADIGRAVDALRRDGIAGLAELARSRTRASAEATVDAIAAIADALGLSVVVVVPEVNLADWSRSRPVGWLGGDGASRWHGLHRQAMASLAAGDYAALRSLADQMAALDGGTTATSLELLARAEAAEGDAVRARELLRQAVEARTWDNFPSVPSATPTVQSVLRASSRHGFTVVDLPAVFAAAPAGGLPGRRQFLDYCHLTPAGMDTAMAAVAEAVLGIAGPPGSEDPGWQALRGQAGVAVPPAADAQVKFMTVLYGAHYGSDHDPYTSAGGVAEQGLAPYWLHEARASSRDIDPILMAYVRSRGAPFHSFALSAHQQHLHGALTGLEGQTAQSPGFDPEMVEMLCAALEADHPGMGEDVVASLVETHGIGARPVDLCHPAYYWSMADQHAGGGFAPPAAGIHRARWSRSNFCFVSDGAAGLAVDLSARLPVIDGERGGALGIHVNGRAVGEMALDGWWSRGRFTLPRAALKRGFNKLTLVWPPLPPAGDAALRSIAERLEVGTPVDLHPVFGELFALRLGAKER